MKNEKISPQEQRRNEAYNEYVKQVTPTHNLWTNMFKAFALGGFICLIGQFIVNIGMNNFDLEQKEAFKSLSIPSKLGWCRGAGAYYRICKWCLCFSDRIQKRRPGIWYWLSDIPNCWTGDFVWDIQQLGAGADLLDIEDDGSGVNHSLFWHFVQIKYNHALRCVAIYVTIIEK